jgi:hypothetical protein
MRSNRGVPSIASFNFIVIAGAARPNFHPLRCVASTSSKSLGARKFHEIIPFTIRAFDHTSTQLQSQQQFRASVKIGKFHATGKSCVIFQVLRSRWNKRARHGPASDTKQVRARGPE